MVGVLMRPGRRWRPLVPWLVAVMVSVPVALVAATPGWAGPAVAADTGILRVSAVFDDGSALPDTALVRVDGIDAGATDGSGSAEVTWAEGPVEVAVVLPSLARGSTSATVVAGESTDVHVVLLDGGEAYEPGRLTMDEAVNGGLDAATPSVTLRFRREADPAAIPVAFVQLATVETPADPEADVTSLFRVAPDGAVVAADMPALVARLASLSSSTVSLSVQAVDAAGLSYADTVTFAWGLSRLTVALEAPPSKLDLRVASTQVAVHYGQVDATIATDAAGRFVLDRVPTGPVSLTATALAGESVFTGAAEVTVSENGTLTVTMRGAADVLAGVPPWRLTADAGARAVPAGPPGARARTSGPAGGRAETAGPAQTGDVTIQSASVIASSATVNVPQVRSATTTVAKGTADIVLAYNVQSQEYPNFVLPQSPYNDTWGISVLGPAGQVLFAISRSVNSQVQTPPIWQPDPFLGGVTGQIRHELDVSGLTVNSDVVLTLVAVATNVGATGGTTKVDVSLGAFSPSLSVSGVRKDRVPQPASGHSDRFSIPRPGAANTFQRTLDVDFSKAADVTVTRAKVELLSGSGTVLQTVTDAAVGDPGVALLDADTLRVRATFGDGVQSNVVSTPPPTDTVRYRVTLTGRRASGSTLTSSARLSAEFFALWRMPDGFDRYSPSDNGPRDNGGDDWASRSTYDWMSTNRALVTRVNDISGEHARNIGHATHLEGRDIDLYHVYNFPNNAAFNGTVNFYRLAQDTQAAMAGNAESRARVVAWASQTRTRFSSLIADADTERIYYAIGRPIGGSPAVALGRGWAQALLTGGRYTNAAGQELDLGVGAWADAGSTKMRYNETHDNHFHVTLTR